VYVPSPPFHLTVELSTAQSKECQKLSWKLTHKYTCMPNSVPDEEKAHLKPHAKIVSAWQNVWRELLDSFAVISLDLVNNPGKNATHWCVLHSAIAFLIGSPFFSFSMWLEFKYAGCEANSEKFEVLNLPLSHLTLPLNTIQFTGGCVRTNDEVLAKYPELKIMRDTPQLVGRQVRYVTVFRFEEWGKPLQSFIRARSLVLFGDMDVLKEQSGGWEPVSGALQHLFGPLGEKGTV